MWGLLGATAAHACSCVCVVCMDNGVCLCARVSGSGSVCVQLASPTGAFQMLLPCQPAWHLQGTVPAWPTAGRLSAPVVRLCWAMASQQSASQTDVQQLAFQGLTEVSGAVLSSSPGGSPWQTQGEGSSCFGICVGLRWGTGLVATQLPRGAVQ